ncbi:MAG: hypothetical protein G01um10142_256 [Parcubacteria group bacterium Gr01-1014_2]|nr:MAG: hypothetical protein G01um10142_256 [Parcubacteria group bacterium Gr01-1014_2]
MLYKYQMIKKANALIIIILLLLFFSIFIKKADIFAVQDRPNLDIVLLFDHSFSMFEYKDGRMYEAQVAAINFVDHLDSAYDRIGLIRFSDYAEINKQLGALFIDVKKKIDSYHVDDFSKFSNLQKAIAKAVEELTSIRARPNAKKLAILLSDGSINRPKLNGREDISYAHSQALQEADTAKNKGIVIHTVTVGGDKADQELLAAIAARTGGNNYIATSPINLIPVFEHIASTLTTNSSGDGRGYVYTVEKASKTVPIPISINKSEAIKKNDNNNYYEISYLSVGAAQETEQGTDQDQEKEPEKNKAARQKALLLGSILSDSGWKAALIIIAGLIGTYLTWLVKTYKRQSL